jgi:hypothetical protein
MTNKYDLFIRINNGIPVFFPSTRENILASFKDVDLENPHLSSVRFEKAKMIPQPEEFVGYQFKVWEETPYTFDGEYWVNGWIKRDMTDKERQEQIISNEISERREKQIKKYLDSVGVPEDATNEQKRIALDASPGPEYVFSLDV